MNTIYKRTSISALIVEMNEASFDETQNVPDA